LHQIWEIGADNFGGIFLFKGPKEADFNGIPAGFVNLEILQAVQPGLGRDSGINIIFFLISCMLHACHQIWCCKEFRGGTQLCLLMWQNSDMNVWLEEFLGSPE